MLDYIEIGVILIFVLFVIAFTYAYDVSIKLDDVDGNDDDINEGE